MRIMFYINTLAGGGAQRVMSNLANMFSEAGDEVIFVTSFTAEGEYPLDKGVDRRSLSAQRITSLLQRNVTYVMELRKLVKQEKPDVLLAFMRQPNYRAVVAGLGLKTKTLISVRCDPKVEYRGRVGHFLGKNLLPLADGCIFQTEDAKLWFPEKLQKKSRVIANAVKRDFYSVEPAPVPGRIVTCGRMTNQKNHRMLIDAFADAAKDIPHAQLHIYGDGMLRQELAAQIESTGMSDKIKLMGQTSDVPGVLREASIFVLSSNFEGMPNALMEAMAAGVACISTDCPCGGPAMLIENGKSGILTPVGDKAALTEAIRRLLLDQEQTERLGREARIAAEQFLPEKIFAQWREYLGSFCQDGKAV